jgi:predicted nuclease of restriction endonuclease-like (RecB) superfamily
VRSEGRAEELMENCILEVGDEFEFMLNHWKLELFDGDFYSNLTLVSPCAKVTYRLNHWQN